MLRCGWEGEPANDWGYTVEAEFTVCLVLLPLETFNSLKAHLAPGPESAAGHAPCRGSLRLLHGPPSWHTPARRPFRLGALGQVEGAIHCPSLENTGQPQIRRHQSKSGLCGGVGNRTGLGVSRVIGRSLTVSAMDVLPSWKGVLAFSVRSYSS